MTRPGYIIEFNKLNCSINNNACTELILLYKRSDSHAHIDNYVFPMQPLSKNKMLFIEPKTIKYHASYYKSTMTIIDSERIIHFNTGGTSYEELIRVPLAGPGELDPHSVIRITVALKPRTTEESDPHIGLTDGIAENNIRIDDTAGACYVNPGSSNTARLPSGTTQHYEYIMLFEPFQNYGACSHIGGHITPGYFNQRLDVSKGLDFIVKRENTDEDYDFYYFLIEIV